MPSYRTWKIVAIGAVCAGALLGLGAVGAAAIYETGLADRAKARLTANLNTPPIAGDERATTTRTLQTALMDIELTEISIGDVNGLAAGGGLDQFGDFLVFSSSRGRIGYLDHENQKIGYLASAVPLNEDGFSQSAAHDYPKFNPNSFRVHDVMVQPRGDGNADLLVSHHLYIENPEEVCALVSKIGIERDGESLRLVGDWTEVYRVDFCFDLPANDYHFPGHMTGARMSAVPDDPTKILLTVGEFGMGGAPYYEFDLITADSGNDLCKLIRIDLVTGEREIVATGLRNAQGLTIDDQGRMWTTEHGPQGGDELNLIEEGVNYGWPAAAYGTDYGDHYASRNPIHAVPEQGRHDGYRAPAWAFVPSVAPSQLVFVPQDSDTFEAWSGDLIVSTLREMTLFRVRLEGDRPVYKEPIEIGHRVRDAIRMDDGRYALLSQSGSIILVSDAGAANGEPEISAVSGYDNVKLVEASLETSQRNWPRDLFRFHCSDCHGFAGDNVGPPLTGIIGRDIGSVENYPYSAALSDASGKWTQSRLEAYLLDPESAGFSGTSMPVIDFDRENPHLLDAIIEYADNPE